MQLGGRHVGRGRQRLPRLQERGGAGGNGKGCHHEGRRLAVGRLRRQGEAVAVTCHHLPSSCGLDRVAVAILRRRSSSDTYCNIII